MSNYDDYFTHDDKPFAENLNDALLLSNVFDLTVPIEMPLMFSNQTWVNSTSKRKCGVSIVKLGSTLPSGLSVSTLNDESVITGTGTMQLLVYPNFNSFGKFKSFDWNSVNDNITVNLKTKTGTTILSDISKGTLESVPSALQQLDQIIIELVFTANDTLKSLSFVMENKQQERYGADVSIPSVSGLSEILDSYDNDISTINDNITNIDNAISTSDWIYLYQSANNPFCEAHVYLRKYNGFLEIQGTFNRQGTGVHTLTVEIPEELRFTPKATTTSRYYEFPLISTKFFIGRFNGERIYFSYDTSVSGAQVTHYFYGLYPID